MTYKPTVGQRLWHIYNNIHNIILCQECGKETLYLKFSDGYKKTCSKECRYGDVAKNKGNVENRRDKNGAQKDGQLSG